MASNTVQPPTRPLKDGKQLQEDIRKCGEEIKQLRNQQLILGTTALGLFGAYAAVLPRFSLLSPARPDLYIWTGIALLGVFFFLFTWTRQLRVLIGVISVWLELVGESTWEHDYRAYHKRYAPVSQTRLVSLAFLVMGFGVPGLVVAMSPAGEQAADCWKWVALAVAVTLYVVAVVEWGFRKRGIDEGVVRSNWIDTILALSQGTPNQTLQQTGAATSVSGSS